MLRLPANNLARAHRLPTWLPDGQDIRVGRARAHPGSSPSMKFAFFAALFSARADAMPCGRSTTGTLRARLVVPTS
jgi:hypothetical protein